MRLLVYGGNQYSERRRIGAWPEAITAQVLRDTHGVSERRPSFGVGLLGDAPFLIMRRIEEYNRRSYPLTMLFDPGLETWESFAWNGAHLLYALFVGAASPGDGLMKEPEQYHSEQHLEELVRGLEVNKLPTEAEPLEGAERWLDLWSGATLSGAPLVVTPDEQVTGFTDRPSLKDLAFLIGHLTVPLRCAKGWLIGGDTDHAQTLGTHFILDDSKTEPPAPDEVKALLAIQKRGHCLRTTLDSSAAQPLDTSLKELPSLPLWAWEREGYTVHQTLEDILLLGELREGDAGMNIMKLEQLEEQFGRVNARLRNEGLLNAEIADAAYLLLEPHKRALPTEASLFILNHGRRDKGRKINKTLLELVDKDVAADFFIESEIYPMDAPGWMPIHSRYAVCKKLLGKEERENSIPDLFMKEARAELPYTEAELEHLLKVAVTRSADFERALGNWRKYFDDETLGEQIRETVRSEARNRISSNRPGALAYYFLLGEDLDGEYLREKTERDGSELLRRVVGFAIDNCADKSKPELRLKTHEWLDRLAVSELRLNVEPEQKDNIPLPRNAGWKNYHALRRAFKGEIPARHAPLKTELAERRFLSEELALTARLVPNPRIGFIPDLEMLHHLLSPDHLEIVVDAMEPLMPDLRAETRAESWVAGWSKLSVEKLLGGPLQQRCLRKFQMEWIRLLIETDAPLTPPNRLKLLGEQEQKYLFAELFWGGTEQDDERRCRRLIQVLDSNHYKAMNQDVLPSVYREMHLSAAQERSFMQRFLSNQKAQGLIAERLDKQQSSELEQWVSNEKEQKLVETRQRIVSILTLDMTETSPREALIKIQQGANAVDKRIFKQAVSEASDIAFEEPSKSNAFLAACAKDEELLTFIKGLLSDSQLSRLRELLDTKKQHDHVHRIRECIYGGKQSDDHRYREELLKLLKSKKNDEMSDATVEEAVKAVLHAGPERAAFFKRYVFHSIAATGEDGTRGKISERDVTLNLLLQHLTPETRLEFMSKLFEFNGGDDEANPLFEVARNIFRRLMKTKGSKRKKKTEQGEHKPRRVFEESLVIFLSSNHELKKLVGIRELGADQAWKIDQYLSAYLPPSGAPAPPAEDRLEPKPSKGLKDTFWGLFRINGGDGGR